MTDWTTRRRLLQLTGAGLALSLAGCTSGGSETDQTTSATTAGQSNNTTTTAATTTRTATPEDPSEPSGDTTVEMWTEGSETGFAPDIVWVEQGATVTWKQVSGVHSATAYHLDYDQPTRIPDEAEPWDSEVLVDEGAVFEHTFEVEGVYDYFCTPHEKVGMLGTVIVGKPSPDGQPGLEPPQKMLPEEAQKKIEELNERTKKILDG
ncbi:MULTISPECIES: plastocyanin/azurin family copper-binding protein [unclassified Haladaptatus]|uniref:plastocyanin/azurin family copper-binding protein n=1 Tax=unclassified Haladaptatus TaxID=2622732 RepID=UPI0023E8AA7C|nr:MULTISPECIES: plastocyanin/azurin family copper-binding protein [unclassified Haladaptatus]